MPKNLTLSDSLGHAPETSQGEAENQELLKKTQPKLDQRFIKTIEGRDFVLYAGLLDLAHQKGLIKMAVEIIQIPADENGHMAIVQAQAESKLGETYTDVGDATPSNCNVKVVKHLLRMASTRAKARALRDFTNIGMTCLEELADFNDIAEGENNDQTPAQKRLKGIRTLKPAAQAPETPAAGKRSTPLVKMSAAQERAIMNLAKRRGLNQEELNKLSLEAYGTEFTELTVADASQMIRHLQQSA